MLVLQRLWRGIFTDLKIAEVGICIPVSYRDGTIPY